MCNMLFLFPQLSFPSCLSTWPSGSALPALLRLILSLVTTTNTDTRQLPCPQVVSHCVHACPLDAVALSPWKPQPLQKTCHRRRSWGRAWCSRTLRDWHWPLFMSTTRKRTTFKLSCSFTWQSWRMLLKHCAWKTSKVEKRNRHQSDWMLCYAPGCRPFIQ